MNANLVAIPLFKLKIQIYKIIYGLAEMIMVPLNFILEDLTKNSVQKYYASKQGSIVRNVAYV